MVDKIKVILPPHSNNDVDLRLWPSSKNGNYTMSTTYELLCGFDKLVRDKIGRKCGSWQFQK